MSDTVMRDLRIDQIGFADELKKQHVDRLRAGVKEAMAANGAAAASGDFFDATYVGGDTRSIDAEKFFKLFEKGIISRGELLSAIKVSVSDAGRVLCDKAMTKICTSTPSAPTLRVTRKKDIEVDLVKALKGLGKALKA